MPNKLIWQQISNRHVIEKLISAGTNENIEHFIEHGIHGTLGDLEKLFTELKTEGFVLIEMREEFLEIGIKSDIELDEITNQTDYLINISEKYRCKYDGWQTAIVK